MSRATIFGFGAFVGGSSVLAVMEFYQRRNKPAPVVDSSGTRVPPPALPYPPPPSPSPLGGGPSQAYPPPPPQTAVPLATKGPSAPPPHPSAVSATASASGASPPHRISSGATMPTQLFKYGLPSTENVRLFSEYVCSINYERRVPNWVLEYLSPLNLVEAEQKRGGGQQEGTVKDKSSSSPTAVDRSRSAFYSDSQVPEPFRSSNTDYSKGGLSRGHLAAAQFHKSSQKSLDETFNLSTNIVPQDMSMNGCDWYRLEDMVKKVRKAHKDAGIWVVTGPAFIPRRVISPSPTQQQQPTLEIRYPLIGNHSVAVPTHLFKVVLVETNVAPPHQQSSATTKKGAVVVKGPTKRYAAAFLMANAPIPTERPLTGFQIPLAELEKYTGLQFFPALLHNNGTHAGTVSPGGSNPAQPSPMLLDLCRETSQGCNGSYGSFSNKYRQEAQLRTASSLQELQAAWTKSDQKDEALKKEFEKRLRALSSPPPPSTLGQGVFVAEQSAAYTGGKL